MPRLVCHSYTIFKESKNAVMWKAESVRAEEEEEEEEMVEIRKEEEVMMKRKEEEEEEVVVKKGSIKSKYSKMSEADLYGFSCPRQVIVTDKFIKINT